MGTSKTIELLPKAVMRGSSEDHYICLVLGERKSIRDMHVSIYMHALYNISLVYIYLNFKYIYIFNFKLYNFKFTYTYINFQFYIYTERDLL